VFTLPSVGAANADHGLAHPVPLTHTRSSRESATNTLLHAYHRSNITPAAVPKGQNTDAIETCVVGHSRIKVGLNLFHLQSKTDSRPHISLDTLTLHNTRLTSR